MKNVYVLLIVSIFFSACNKQEENSHIEKIKISLQKVLQIDVDSVIEDVKLVPLETNENCLVNHVDKIKICNERIFILDRKSGNILIFKKTGEFISKISKQGKGSGEYIMIADFGINPSTDELYILDGMTDKLLVFKDGNFIKDYKLDFGVKITNFCFIGDKMMAFENQISTEVDGLKYYLFITDENLKLISKEIPYEKSNALIMSPVSSFSTFDQKISYFPVYKDSVYHIDNHQIRPSYILDFGKNWIDEEYLYNKKINPMTFFQDLKNSNSIYLLNVIESRSHIFMYFTFKDEKYAFLYDKDTKKGKFIKNYMKNGCGYNGLPMVPDGDLFVGIVNPYELSNINEKKLLHKYPHLNSKISDNSIISFIKFKNIN